MIGLGAAPSVATMRDVVDFVIFPLIVALVMALLTFAVWIVRKLQDHSEALGLLLHEVNPANAPSLRDQLQAIKLDVGTMKAQPSNHGNP
jgi:flagellar biogenesis protein FliO